MVLETGSLRSGSVWFVDVLLDPFREGEMALPLYMDINPNMEVPPSRPSHLPKAPPPHTITLGVRVSAYGFGGALEMQETQETCVQFLDQEDPLEEGMATHSSILA